MVSKVINNTRLSLLGRLMEAVMPIDSVSTIGSSVNPTLDDVRGWVAAMGTKGIFNGATARLRATALNQMETILGPDEPREARWVLDNLKSIAQRFAIKNQSNPETAATYESRARGALTDYFKYLENPTRFSPRAARARPVRPVRESESRASADESAQLQTRQLDQAPALQRVSHSRECPLGKDRTPFRYELPSDGLVMADVLRIAMHLASGAHDFEPTKQVVVLNHYDRLPEASH